MSAGCLLPQTACHTTWATLENFFIYPINLYTDTVMDLVVHASPKSPLCNGHGVFEHGACHCSVWFVGQQCDASIMSSVPPAELTAFRYATVVCHGILCVFALLCLLSKFQWRSHKLYGRARQANVGDTVMLGCAIASGMRAASSILLLDFAANVAVRGTLLRIPEVHVREAVCVSRRDALQQLRSRLRIGHVHLHGCYALFC